MCNHTRKLKTVFDVGVKGKYKRIVGQPTKLKNAIRILRKLSKTIQKDEVLFLERYRNGRVKEEVIYSVPNDSEREF